MEIMGPSDYARMGGMGRRGIGGLRGQFNRRRAMGRPAYPTPAPGQNFDLPSRPMGGMMNPMGGVAAYRPPQMGMDFSVGAPGMSSAQPAQPYPSQFKQFDPRMMLQPDVASGPTGGPGLSVPTIENPVTDPAALMSPVFQTARVCTTTFSTTSSTAV
jgi:hypothetical protein